MTWRLLVVPTKQAAAALAAAQIMDALRATPDLVLGLAAGRTFEPVYTALCQARPDLSHATLVQLDEYLGFGADHPGSFRAFLIRTFIGSPSSAPRALLIDGAAPDPDAEIHRHAVQMRDIGGLGLQLLGLGLNGHIAFNEPGSDPEQIARVVALASSTRTAAEAAGLYPAPTHGLTLGLAEILDARALLLVVLGAHKAEILAQLCASSPSPALPASFLMTHPDLTIVADAEAAATFEPACRRGYA